MIRRLLGLSAVLALLLAGAGCGSKSVSDGRSPQAALDLAATTLSETPGVHLTLLGKLPPGVTGLTGADGTATRAPAFDGTLTVTISAGTFQVPVKAVGGKVYAQIPLTPGWSQVNPADYQAPDPATLISASGGIPAVMKATTGLTKGADTRGGTNNGEILTTYTGSVPAAAMKQFLPSASGDTFSVVYEIAGNGELRQATMTGQFYAGTPTMTYDLSLVSYGTTATVTAP